jgi:hypothetical protein
MRRFERDADGTLVAITDADEAQLLTTLASQIADLVGSVGAGDVRDPAIVRLLPDAYPDDAGASAEFRRFTAEGLGTRKVLNAQRLIASLEQVSSTGEIRLDEQDAGAWLRSLTDIRLVLAERLGIKTEDDDDGLEVDPIMRDVYDWLGFVQNSLVEALDG